MVLYKVSVLYADQKSKMATTAGHRLTLDPMGKFSNTFFSETTNQTESKLDKNVHWMVLYKIRFFVRYKMEDGGYSRTYFNIGPYVKSVSKRVLSEITWTI